MNYYKAKLKYLRLFNKLKDIDQQLIAKNSYYSYCYALNGLNGRFILGETAIATSDYCAYCYAYNVLDGRFELGETTIAKCGHYSYLYARDVLKGRFILGEHDIAKEYKHRYNQFLKQQGINFELQ